MKQIALLLATAAALVVPGAASAQFAPTPRLAPRPPVLAPRPSMVRPPVVAPRPPVAAPFANRPPPPYLPPPHGFGQHPPGAFQHGRYRNGPANFNGSNWATFMAPPGEAARDIVNREFVYSPVYPPRLPTMVVLDDRPVVFREPPHIIELGRHKRRRPIDVVRRGEISRE
jgi:hypothetical protein